MTANMHCKYAGSGRPRVLVGRHADDCAYDICSGCQPCEDGHCVVCGMTHAAGACAECVASTRDDLRSIATLCDSLPEEVEHRGINGEAMVLLGPAADPEARGHLEASIAAGRVPADYLDVADGEQHPLFVLGTWDMTWRDALEHEEPTERLTIATATDYLDRQMTYMAGYEHAPFEDFARDLRECRSQLERVLHDGEQRDVGAPCMGCGATLERVWGDDEASDGWKCPRCRERSTEAQYRFAVMDLHRRSATHLTDREMQERTGIKAGTVREWARRALIGRKRDSGRVVYCVEDVERVGEDKGMIPTKQETA